MFWWLVKNQLSKQGPHTYTLLPVHVTSATSAGPCCGQPSLGTHRAHLCVFTAHEVPFPIMTLGWVTWLGLTNRIRKWMQANTHTSSQRANKKILDLPLEIHLPWQGYPRTYIGRSQTPAGSPAKTVDISYIPDIVLRHREVVLTEVREVGQFVISQKMIETLHFYSLTQKTISHLMETLPQSQEQLISTIVLYEQNGRKWPVQHQGLVKD